MRRKAYWAAIAVNVFGLWFGPWCGDYRYIPLHLGLMIWITLERAWTTEA